MVTIRCNPIFGIGGEFFEGDFVGTYLEKTGPNKKIYLGILREHITSEDIHDRYKEEIKLRPYIELGLVSGDAYRASLHRGLLTIEASPHKLLDESIWEMYSNGGRDLLRRLGIKPVQAEVLVLPNDDYAVRLNEVQK